MFTLDNFYKSRQWESFVKQIKLERVNDNGEIICEHCGKPITRKYDCIAHHKIELTEEYVNDYEISFNPDNIELIHFKCHNKQHGRFEGFRQQVYLVYGSPCSGKEAWVNDNAEPDDLIINIDKIWECISTSDRYHKSNRLKANVFGLRDCLYEQVKLRKGMWRSAYIIGGYPLRTDRERLCDLLRATPIFIDESKEKCLERAQNEKMCEYINEWFECYVP